MDHSALNNGSAILRIEFANAELPDFEWTRRELRIGSAADDDLVLRGSGISEHHLRLSQDLRGMVMTVTPGAGHVYLNARKVRERALLRAGDCLGIGDVVLRLVRPQTHEQAEKIDSASLRAVAGPLSGRTRAVGDRLDLGNDDSWSLGLGQAPGTCVSIVRRDDGMHLHAVQLPDTCVLCVNGLPVRETPLHDGDQIAIGPHRFVLDACVTQAPEPLVPEPQPELPENDAGPRREVWWLILTAAVLALVIAVLLFVRI
jgi:pSer/pThr/pTyr-binding forkhead associated (FHA) protein